MKNKSVLVEVQNFHWQEKNIFRSKVLFWRERPDGTWSCYRVLLENVSTQSYRRLLNLLGSMGILPTVDTACPSHTTIRFDTR